MSYYRFRDRDGQEFGNFETFYDDSDTGPWSGEPRNFGSDDKPVKPGWYWWACCPGCLPDGEPSGPFDTEDEAILHRGEF